MTANTGAFLFAIAFAMAGLLGCERRSGRQLTDVRIGYFANLTHAQAVLGASSGEFADAVRPLEFSTKLFNAGPSLVEALLAGEIDIGYVGPGPALNAQLRTRGRGIRVIAGAAANGVLIVARKGSAISSLSDLRGRKLATPQHGNTQDLSARHYLVSVLHQADDRNVLPVPNAEQSGMMARAPEPWGSRLMAETGATLVAEEKDLWPAKEFTLTVVVTTPEFLAQHADVVEKVLRVHSRWTHRLQSEPKRYVPQLESALLALTGKKLPKGVMASALRRVKFTDDVLEDTFRAQATWSYELEFTVQPPSIAGLIDTRLLQRLRANNLGRDTGLSPVLSTVRTGETSVSR
jgi:NitT/TauT family transport system substrate-binding protein